MNEMTNLTSLYREMQVSRIGRVVAASSVGDFLEKSRDNRLNYVELGAHAELYTNCHRISMIMQSCSRKVEEKTKVVLYESNMVQYDDRDVDYTRNVRMMPEMRKIKRLWESRGDVRNPIAFIVPVIELEPKW